MPELNIFDQSYQPYTTDSSIRSLINFYMEESPESPASFKFLNTPGALEYSNLSGSEIRGMLAHKNVGYVVKDNKVYSVTDATTPVTTEIGTITTTTGRVSIAAINTEILFADGTKVWSYLPASSTFAEVVDGDLPSNVSYVTAHLGYFIALKPNDDQFFVSDLNDGTSWNSLNFASAELSYDNLVAAIPSNQTVWFLGDITTELWYNSGAATGAPYDRRSGGALPFGCAAAFSAIEINSEVFFLAQNTSGLIGVMRANESGFNIVSTRPMLEQFNSYNSISDAFSWSYSINSHTFYVITFPDAGDNRGRSWQYDLTTGKWNELQSYNAEDPLIQPQTRHFANCQMYLNRKLIVGDYNSGILYELSEDYTDEDGADITREMVSNNIEMENKYITINNLTLRAQSNLETATDAPTISLSVSKDRGNTWSPELIRNISHTGEYDVQTVWTRLGSSKVFTFKLSFSGDVKWSILSTKAKVRVGVE